MRNYEYEKRWYKLLTPEIVGYLTTIHEYKVEQRFIVNKDEKVLIELVEMAKIQSIESAGRLEGVYTSDAQLRKIALNKAMPQDRNEQEIAGYRDALNIIQDNYGHMPVQASFILQLHTDLYKYGGGSVGGQYRKIDKVFTESDTRNGKVKFKPVSVEEISGSIDEICRSYTKLINDTQMDPLLIIPVFILDFLCINPFYSGNERMSKLLTTLLLHRAGYLVGKYISLERLIEESVDAYYDAVAKSSAGWHEEENDYAPFVKYMLWVIQTAYKDFFARTKLITRDNVSKPERIAEEIKKHVGTITKTELADTVPNVSQTTVQRTLNNLLKERKIIKIGGGRYTRYKWNWEEENK